MATAVEFQNVLELVQHLCEELVDDPDSVEVVGAYVGVTGAIQITGPTSEIAKIIGSNKARISAIESIVGAVSAKYGFRVLLNVLNNEKKRALEEGHEDV